VEWLKVKALSSNPSTEKKKKYIYIYIYYNKRHLKLMSGFFWGGTGILNLGLALPVKECLQPFLLLLFFRWDLMLFCPGWPQTMILFPPSPV
jgi:hypothetical protein